MMQDFNIVIGSQRPFPLSRQFQPLTPLLTFCETFTKRVLKAWLMEGPTLITIFEFETKTGYFADNNENSRNEFTEFLPELIPR